MAADDAPAAFSSAAGARLEAIKRALLNEIVQRLQRLDQSGGALSSEADALDTARRIRTQVLSIMQDHAIPVIVSASEAAVIDAVDAALRTHQPAAGVDNGGMIGFSVEADARDSILRSVSGALDDLPAVLEDAAREIRKALDVGVNTGAPLTDVIDEVAQALDTSFAQAETAVDTAIRGGWRMALVQQTERGAEAAGVMMVYLYLGPDDAKDRPFCAEHVGHVYTLDYLKGLDNGQGLPVVPYCGGWNCRHTLSPLTVEDAHAEGYEVIG